MKLNIYKDQKTIEKTYEAETYDIMFGTVEDLFRVLEDVKDISDETQIFEIVRKNWDKVSELLRDIFPGLTKEELRHVKIRELLPLFVELFLMMRESFPSTSKN